MDLGIYTNVEQTDERSNGKIIYTAKCTICGQTFKRTMSHLKRDCHECHHKSPITKNGGINDMPPGWSVSNELNHRIYNAWAHMLRRASEDFLIDRPTYKGTVVCERWHTLSNFVEDIKNLPGYDKWLANEEKYMLDKDLLGNGQKLYSPETCCFLNSKESAQEVYGRKPEVINKIQNYTNSIKKPVRIIKVDDNSITKDFESMQQCADFLKVSRLRVWRVLSELESCVHDKTCKGYYIIFLNNKENKNEER